MTQEKQLQVELLREQLESADRIAADISERFYGSHVDDIRFYHGLLWSFLGTTIVGTVSLLLFR